MYKKSVAYNCGWPYGEDAVEVNYPVNPGEGIKPEDEQKYEMVDHPSHYNQWSMEVIEMMRKIYGDERTADWCEMTAYKYAMRMGFKPTDDVMQDLDKRNWYLNKAKSIREESEAKKNGTE